MNTKSRRANWGSRHCSLTFKPENRCGPPACASRWQQAMQLFKFYCSHLVTFWVHLHTDAPCFSIVFHYEPLPHSKKDMTVVICVRCRKGVSFIFVTEKWMILFRISHNKGTHYSFVYSEFYFIHLFGKNVYYPLNCHRTSWSSG
jgi:hypothetical protein